MTFRPIFSALATLLLCTTTASSRLPATHAHRTAPGRAVHPAIWKLADADTTIYLFGTIHVLPKGLAWRTPLFDRIAQKSGTLVLEVNDLDDKNKTAATFMKLAISPNLPNLDDRVPPAKRAALDKMVKDSKVPMALLDRFENWAVAITLAAGTLRELDVSPDYGVEHQLRDDFMTAHKPVQGLETSEWQLGLFDKLSEGAQKTFLLSMIDNKTDPKTEYETMLAAWRSGDAKRIALSFDDEVKLSPELTDVLIHRRNANWTDWLAKRLEMPGTVLVAVGAGHLAGPDSVQTMLIKRGLKVTRIQ
jgi:uncharacterized protein YbaP (TraB family)